MTDGFSNGEKSSTAEDHAVTTREVHTQECFMSCDLLREAAKCIPSGYGSSPEGRQARLRLSLWGLKGGASGAVFPFQPECFSFHSRRTTLFCDVQ